MRLFVRVSGGLLLAALVTASPARSASSWRCGARLIGTGQSPSDVYALCGEPTDRAVSTEFVTVRLQRGIEVTRTVLVERWTYDRGPRQLVRCLTFHDGRLVDIDEGRYGQR